MDISILSPNDLKGYYFEVRVQKELLDLNIEFIGNPRDPTLWKKNVAAGPDIVIPQLDLVIECKAVYSQVWPSGIVPNYIKRFSGSKHKIVVTNDVRMFNPKCKQILTHAGIRLMNIHYFLQWISKLIYSNKGANSITLYSNSITLCFNDYISSSYYSELFNGNFTVYRKERNSEFNNLNYPGPTPYLLKEHIRRREVKQLIRLHKAEVKRRKSLKQLIETS